VSILNIVIQTDLWHHDIDMQPAFSNLMLDLDPIGSCLIHKLLNRGSQDFDPSSEDQHWW
jgi:hypothetical protein